MSSTRRDVRRPRLVAAATAAASVLLQPMFVAYRLGLIDYRGCGECVSLLPGPFGRIVRRAWYSRTLTRCGARLVVHFGTVLRDPRTRIGDDCTFGEFNSVGWATIGDFFVSGDHVSIVAGRHQQRFSRTDVPMRFQTSRTQCVRVADDVWVGSHAVIAADVAAHSIVGASTLIIATFAEWSVLAGTPARIIGSRR
jgi:virginiamycin A acetyltransferase